MLVSKGGRKPAGPQVLVAQGKIKVWGPNINIKINYEIGLTS
jgi:hypothetical protein